jgi:hypothetical protein
VGREEAINPQSAPGTTEGVWSHCPQGTSETWHPGRAALDFRATKNEAMG